MDKLEAPYFPIIYVRGYAMTPGEIADTVATPYMGFNLGATKLRQRVDGSVHRHVFESPLIRLMKDHGYRDIYAEGGEIEGESAGTQCGDLPLLRTGRSGTGRKRGVVGRRGCCRAEKSHP